MDAAGSLAVTSVPPPSSSIVSTREPEPQWRDGISAYYSQGLVEQFLSGIPLVFDQTVAKLKGTPAWEAFVASCANAGTTNNASELSNLVRALLQQPDINQHLDDETATSNIRRGHVRIATPGTRSTVAWTGTASEPKINSKDSTEPELHMVSMLTDKNPLSQFQVRPVAANTICPSRSQWLQEYVTDDCSPLIEWEQVAWECVDVIWECKPSSRLSGQEKLEVLKTVTLKAAQALRFQYSRRHIYCFLHFGVDMLLLLFDRSGIVVSQKVNIEADTATFISCILAVFYHPPGRLGYPVGPSIPFQMVDPRGNLRQIVTVGGHDFWLGRPVQSPPGDQLVSRATVAFEAWPVIPPPGMHDRRCCYKASWVFDYRVHEGHYLDQLSNLSSVVKVVAHDVIQLGDGIKDTIKQGRGSCIQGRRWCAKTAPSGGGQPPTTRPMARIGCFEREHRQVVTAWVEFAFHQAINKLAFDTHLSLWLQAFEALQDITRAGYCHGDISFNNVRVTEDKKVKICDFDLASTLASHAEKASDRTGTTPFVATAILASAKVNHQPVYDCESLFWVCALSLLARIGNKETVDRLKTLLTPNIGARTIVDTRQAIMDELRLFHGIFDIAKPMDGNTDVILRLLQCLSRMARLFIDNGFLHIHSEDEKTEFDQQPFAHCIKIIRDSMSGHA